MAKRFYQISFELGVGPRALIQQLAPLGLFVGNQMVVVQPALEERIRDLYATLHPREEAPEPSTATAVLDEAPRASEERAGESAETAIADERPVAESEPVAEAPTPAVATAEPVAPAAEAPVATNGKATAPAHAPTVEEVHAAAHAHPKGTHTPVVETTAAAKEAPVKAHAPTAHAPVADTKAGPAKPAAKAPPAGPTTPPTSAPIGSIPKPAAPKPKTVSPAIGYQAMQPSSKAKPRVSGDLIPTIDPRAGRLLKAAPKAPIPGVTTPRTPARPPAGAPGVGNLNPTLAKSAPAPGARRDSRTGRSGEGPSSAERHGKQTFQLRSRKRSSQKQAEAVDNAPKTFEVTPPLPLKQFSEISGIKVSDVVKTMLLKHKQLVTPNSMLDEDTLVILGVEFDRDIKFVKQETREDTMLKEAELASPEASLVQRPPVIVVMGHVDHGKTSLLDFIRKADVAAHESGGITQHIGAYQVTLADKRKLTFFDTPGHEAFTEMRRRGAKVTDIVVLVVAADDGVMPQTIEAIDHAKAAGVPIAVAMTKSDKVGFKDEALDRVKQQLAQHGIMVSGWGGEVECFPVAAVGKDAGRGIDKLLEHLCLLAEVEDLKSDPTRPATGTVIEAENNPGRGVLATLLIEQGTLRRGDPVIAGRAWGRIRAMRDDKGANVEEAPPGTPVEVTGLDEVPEVGKPFFVRPDANEVREIAEKRRGRDRELELAREAKPVGLEGLFSAIEQGKVKQLKIILKTDVQGSLEAIRARLDSLGNAEVKVQVIRAGVGAVSESDITMAATYGALVVGFHVVADETARMKGKQLGVDIRMYKIIYELEDALKAMLEGKLSPESRESIIGHAEVLQLFRSTKLGNICGCRVRDGVIRRDAKVRLARDGIVVWEGAIGSLRREKDDAKEVKDGFECGIRLEGYDDVKEGDVIEAFTVEQVARTLAT